MKIERILDREEALRLLEHASEYENEEDLPSDLRAKLDELRAAIRNAELFITRFRVVDIGMIEGVRALMLEFQDLYSVWNVAENKSSMLH